MNNSFKVFRGVIICLCLPNWCVSLTSVDVMAWIDNYIPLFIVDATIYPSPKLYVNIDKKGPGAI